MFYRTRVPVIVVCTPQLKRGILLQNFYSIVCLCANNPRLFILNVKNPVVIQFFL